MYCKPLTAARRSSMPIALNSRPVRTIPAVDSCGSIRPIIRQIVSAVRGLSPVMTTTRMPARLHLAIADLTCGWVCEKTKSLVLIWNSDWEDPDLELGDPEHLK